MQSREHYSIEDIENITLDYCSPTMEPLTKYVKESFLETIKCKDASLSLFFPQELDEIIGFLNFIPDYRFIEAQGRHFVPFMVLDERGETIFASSVMFIPKDEIDAFQFWQQKGSRMNRVSLKELVVPQSFKRDFTNVGFIKANEKSNYLNFFNFIITLGRKLLTNFNALVEVNGSVELTRSHLSRYDSFIIDEIGELKRELIGKTRKISSPIEFIAKKLKLKEQKGIYTISTFGKMFLSEII